MGALKKKNFIIDLSHDNLLLLEKKKEIKRFVKYLEFFKKILNTLEKQNLNYNEKNFFFKKNYKILDMYDSLKKESFLKKEMLSSTSLLDIISYFFFYSTFIDRIQSRK